MRNEFDKASLDSKLKVSERKLKKLQKIYPSLMLLFSEL